MNKLKTIVDNSTNGIELNLILHCLRVYLKTEPPSRISEFIEYHRTKIRWSVFFDLIIIHRVSPIVTKIILTNYTEHFPKCIIRKLIIQSSKNQFQSMELAAETIKLVKSLETVGVRVLVLKGVALAIQLYDDIGMRPTHDIDLLVNQVDLNEVCYTLKNLGYKSNDYELYQSFTEKQKAIVLQTSNHYKFIKNRTIVEIHWRLSSFMNSKSNFENQYSDSETISISNHKIKIISIKENLIYLSVHGAMHAWCRLRWLMDIALLLSKKKCVINLKQLSGFELQAIILVQTLLRVSIEISIKDQLKSPIINSAIKAVHYITKYPGVAPKRFSKKFFTLLDYFFSISFEESFLNMFRRIATPNIADVLTISLPDKLFWLYYPLKPIIWVFRVIINVFHTNNKLC